MTIRGKRPIPLFRLIKANPPGKYRTKKVPCRLNIPPFTGSVVHYIDAFSKRNDLLPSEFTVYNWRVVA